MAQGMADLSEHEADFRGVGLVRALAEIRAQGGEQPVLIRHERVQQGMEPGAAELLRQGRAGLEKRPLARDEWRVIHILVCGMQAMA
jgi:hypothetical protein